MFILAHQRYAFFNFFSYLCNKIWRKKLIIYPPFSVVEFKRLTFTIL